MTKQIILHYPGSYVERPHTIVFDDKDEYQEFLDKKSYKLKPNVKYGVFTLGATISTEYAGNNLKIDVIDKSDWTFNFPDQKPPTIDNAKPEVTDSTVKPDIPINPVEGVKADQPQSDINKPDQADGVDTNTQHEAVQPEVSNEPETKEDTSVVVNPDDKKLESETAQGEKESIPTEPKADPKGGEVTEKPKENVDNSKQDVAPKKIEDFDDVVIFD
ncbi:hypothetical protein YZ82_01540 [Campylobacter hyointestinalis]|uniref:Uncharacterized protein n=1 Tax=Campylobacter hyointestinalis TaxID=198 RepID=A0A562XLU4_CAMHY|nr:hypothetical protein [Campylobacter hyointestinalis]TWO22626.1 hypothetical protein YZ82_01540 [Campylobacter hyointestinalis]